MNYNYRFTCVLIATSLFLLNVSVKAQSLATHGDSSVHLPQRTGWVFEKWSANDKVFPLINKQLQKKILASHDAVSITAAYGELFKKTPKSTVLLFKWGMSTYYASKTKSSTWFPTDSDLLLTSLDVIPSPHSFQYDRMRFLIQSHFRGEDFLKTMGLRLLKVNPGDDEVKSSMFPVLNIVGNPRDGQLALDFANELIAKHPANPRWHAMLGSTYNLISVRTNKRLDCEKAITAYQDYLKLAKKTDPFYSHAEYMISVIKKNMPSI